MPLVWQARPEITLDLIGSHPPAELRRLAGAGVRVRGHVGDLDAALSAARLSVASLRYGAGVKGKVLSSLACGIPCVMTPTAAEGLDLPPALTELVGATAGEIAARILDLYDDEWRCFDLAQAGFRLLDERFSESCIDAAMRDVVTGPALRRAADEKETIA